MTQQKTTVVENMAAEPASGRKTTRTSYEKRFISDERRIKDALEDDDVREA